MKRTVNFKTAIEINKNGREGKKDYKTNKQTNK